MNLRVPILAQDSPHPWILAWALAPPARSQTPTPAHVNLKPGSLQSLSLQGLSNDGSNVF